MGCTKLNAHYPRSTTPRGVGFSEKNTPYGIYFSGFSWLFVVISQLGDLFFRISLDPSITLGKYFFGKSLLFPAILTRGGLFLLKSNGFELIFRLNGCFFPESFGFRAIHEVPCIMKFISISTNLAPNGAYLAHLGLIFPLLEIFFDKSIDLSDISCVLIVIHQIH